jgi:hypothetical protein
MAMTESAKTKGAKYCDASGNIGIEKRMKP